MQKSAAPQRQVSAPQFVPPMSHEDELLYAPALDDNELYTPSFIPYSSYPPPDELPLPSYGTTQSYHPSYTATTVPYTLSPMIHSSDAVKREPYPEESLSPYMNNGFVPGSNLKSESPKLNRPQNPIPTQFTGIITPSQLHDILINKPEHEFILLDVRASTLYAHSRIKGALNLCVPTTLLKRATFDLQKLGKTFQTKEDQERFSQWRGIKHLIIYDTCSVEKRDALSAINMFEKFTNEGYTGNSYLLRGGFDAFYSSCLSLIDHRPRHKDSTSTISVHQSDLANDIEEPFFGIDFNDIESGVPSFLEDNSTRSDELAGPSSLDPSLNFAEDGVSIDAVYSRSARTTTAPNPLAQGYVNNDGSRIPKELPPAEAQEPTFRVERNPFLNGPGRKSAPSRSPAEAQKPTFRVRRNPYLNGPPGREGAPSPSECGSLLEDEGPYGDAIDDDLVDVVADEATEEDAEYQHYTDDKSNSKTFQSMEGASQAAQKSHDATSTITGANQAGISDEAVEEDTKTQHCTDQRPQDVTQGPLVQSPRDALNPTPGGPRAQGSGGSSNGQNANIEKREPVEFNHAIRYINKIKASRCPALVNSVLHPLERHPISLGAFTDISVLTLFSTSSRYQYLGNV
jgi:hypothetical protein